MQHGPHDPVLDHVDVLIVGAGLSGIGAACHLQDECPDKSYAILESRGAIGGTWDLFRYPGIRSDSDMFTLGYAFRPWKDSKAIADGPAIRRYIEDTAAEYGVRDKIRFHHQVLSAEWSTADARWTVTARRTDTGETVRLTCSWLSVCSGYYRYDEGFRPTFPGEERFAGQLIHPQHWPEDLDSDRQAGRRHRQRRHRRHPRAQPGRGRRARDHAAAHAELHPVAARPRPAGPGAAQQAAGDGGLSDRPVEERAALHRLLPVQPPLPEAARRLIRRLTQKQLPNIDVDTHFNPPYNPWDQRLCLVPDGDLFRTLRKGKASIATDTDRDVHREGHRARVRRAPRRRRRRDRDRAEPAAHGRHVAAVDGGRSTSPSRSPTRA